MASLRSWVLLQVSRAEAEAWCDERNLTYFEVSAKESINVEKAFTTAASYALCWVRHLCYHHSYSSRPGRCTLIPAEPLSPSWMVTVGMGLFKSQLKATEVVVRTDRLLKYHISTQHWNPGCQVKWQGVLNHLNQWLRQGPTSEASAPNLFVMFCSFGV